MVGPLKSPTFAPHLRIVATMWLAGLVTAGKYYLFLKNTVYESS